MTVYKTRCCHCGETEGVQTRSECSRCREAREAKAARAVSEAELEARTLRALRMFREWNAVTDCAPRGSTYADETESIIEDAVRIGAGLEPCGEE